MSIERRKCRVAIVSLGLVAGVALGGSAIAQRPGTVPLAFTHVTVIDGTGTPPKGDHTVLVTGDQITAVGTFATVRIPPNARTIDATGRFLIPGLWDAHVHTRYEGIDHLRLLIANGITSTRNMSAPWPHLAEIREWRTQIESGERVGPQLITSGPLLDGPGTGRPNVQLVIANADEGRAAVRRVKSEGADFVKVYNLLSRDSYFAIAAESRAQSLPFSGHVPLAVSALEASDGGQLSLEHLDGILLSVSAQEEQLRKQAQGWRADRPEGRVGGTGPISARVLVESFSADRLRQLAERLAARATRVVPTLSLNWNRFAPSIVRSPDRLRYIPVSYAGEWQRVQSSTGDNSEDDMRARAELGFVVVKELHRAGVPILARTDVGTAYQIPGFTLHDELSLLVKAGLSEMDALQAATRNPARAFRLTNQGTIENGKRADLVLLDANPLENIANTTKIRVVVPRAGCSTETRSMRCWLISNEARVNGQELLRDD